MHELSQKAEYRAMFKDFPDVLSFEQMCLILCISPVTGYKLLRANKVKHLRIGRIYRIPKTHMLEFLKSESH